MQEVALLGEGPYCFGKFIEEQLREKNFEDPNLGVENVGTPTFWGFCQ